ncbi:MAG: 4Fe-4S dicluster domain-containing protein [Rikenellaceae bacterium]|nr:4Fe-4S dicluster domain-containing protein [Rikenellaceae bacterium]MBR2333568.1 4Fe-4S dicluster domain-containing protein [Rikenellaceae bacterium]MBR2451910.1 4Fe-4S dicluster domain-containing protein [Rikenellaceae bacterium]MBR2628562.1 4Fe-4S dicluster domain-containing protein [Alistipes sp.]
MIDFGFGVNVARAVNMDRNNLDTAHDIFNSLPDLQACIACGSCTATCTAGNLTSFNFRKVHTLVRRGEYKEAYSEMSKCMLCGKCRLVCPRGINTRGVVLTIKKKLGDY